MEVIKNLRWVCRVCTVNMKEQSPQLASVHIFGPAGVVVKLKKYFDIEVRRDDPFPKNVCINCFKKLEELHVFARLAVKTDYFWRKYLNFEKPYSLQISAPDFNDAFTAFALSVQAKHPVQPKSKKMKLRLTSDKFIVPLNVAKRDKPMVVASVLPSTSVKATHNSPRNNLEEKRQNLKEVLATNKPQGRINVKSESYLKPPLVNQASSQAPIPQTTRPTEPPPLKVISTPQVTTASFRPVKITPLIQTSLQPIQQPPKLMPTFNPFVESSLKLGQVVKDIDLLTLILKALKWPYTHDDILLKIELLKEEPFHEVIRNPFLLQDADLMQILNTILSPILLQKQQQIAQKQPLVSGFVSYKIPADLSVHLVTEETNTRKVSSVMLTQPKMQANHVKKKLRPIKPKPIKPRPRKISPKVPSCSSPIEILSDDDDVQMFEVDVDPALFFNNESQEKSASCDSPKKEKRNDEMLVFKLQTKNRKKEANRKLSQAKSNEVATSGEKPENGKCENESIASRSVEKADGEPFGIIPAKVASDTEPETTTQSDNQPELIIPDIIPEFAEKTHADSKVGKDAVREGKTAAATIVVEESKSTGLNPAMKDDASGDDDVWAEFKVTESPDTSAEATDKACNPAVVKDEILYDYDDSSREMVIEEVDNSYDETEDNEDPENIKRSSDADNAKAALEALIIKEECYAVADEISENIEENVRDKEEEHPPTESIVESSKEHVDATSVSGIDKRIDALQKSVRNSEDSVSSLEEEMKLKETKEKQDTNTTEDRKIVVNVSLSSRRRGRPKNNLVTKEDAASKTESEDNEVAEETPSAKKPAIRKNEKAKNANKRATRSLTAANNSMSLRNSNTRRRICKQCGQSFTLLADFLDHRKMHIESS